MQGISVFGDSITFGAGDSLHGGWCGRLRKYFEAKGHHNRLYNLGICGNTTTDILQRFDSEVKARDKFIRDCDQQVIIFSVGINDSRLVGKEKNPETEIVVFDKNIQKLIDKAKLYTKEVIFIGLTPVDENFTSNYEGTAFINKRIKQYNDLIKMLCQKNNVPFFDMFKEFSKLGYQKMLDNGLHPNTEGYQKMYELIKSFLIQEKIID